MLVMKTIILILVLMLVVIVPLNVKFLLWNRQAEAAKNCFNFEITGTDHADYGMSYPMTYIFRLNKNVSFGAKAYKRFSASGQWSQIEERTSDEFFNGIEAVRFDYFNHKAYVSVVFEPIYIYIYI